MACLPLRGPRGLRTRRPPSQGYTGLEPRATHHEGPDHDVGHLGQLIVQQRGGGVVRHLRTGTETAVRGRSRPHEAAGRTHAFQTTDELPSRERLPEGRTSKLKPERESRSAARPQGRGAQDAPASGDPAAWRSAWRGWGQWPEAELWGRRGARQPSRGARRGESDGPHPASPPRRDASQQRTRSLCFLSSPFCLVLCSHVGSVIRTLIISDALSLGPH